MSFTDRHVNVSMLDYALFISEQKSRTGIREEGTDFISSKEHSSLKQVVREWLEENVQLITRACPATSLLSPSSVRGQEENNPSIYVGTGGNAYLLWKLSKFYEKEGNAERAALFLKKADEAINVSLRLLQKRKGDGEKIAFYIGHAGVHAVASAIFWKEGEHVKAMEQLKHVLSCLPNALHMSSADEILYGRAGYLFCLKFVQKHVGSELLGDLSLNTTMRQVFDAILESGKRNSAQSRYTPASSLQYDFYGTDYHGAAHGTSGILYMLLQFPEWCVDPGVQPWIMNTLNRMLSTQFTSGNFPADSDNQMDFLIHWCHGAPGFVYMLHEAYKVFKDEKFKRSLDACLKVIWERGVLKKGNGLCHGTAGNGYAFLMMYKHTGTEEHLYRAFKMAEAMWCDEVKKQVAAFYDRQRHCQGVPDFPYSLMEGLGGTICFCCDLLHPDSAAFPGYDGDI